MFTNFRYNAFTGAFDPVYVENESREITSTLLHLYNIPKSTTPSTMNIVSQTGIPYQEVPFDITPELYQYRVCYSGLGTGIIEFNSGNLGDDIYISYYSYGTNFNIDSIKMFDDILLDYETITTNTTKSLEKGLYNIILTAGGGAGGGSSATHAAGGGGSGATLNMFIELPKADYNIVIGVGGTGLPSGTYDDTNTLGRNSSFISSGICNILVYGGSSGGHAPLGGLGGYGGAGTIVFETQNIRVRGCEITTPYIDGVYNISYNNGKTRGITLGSYGGGVGGGAIGSDATVYGCGGGGGATGGGSGDGKEGVCFIRRLR
jgi:hypothetical protein